MLRWINSLHQWKSVDKTQNLEICLLVNLQRNHIVVLIIRSHLSSSNFSFLTTCHNIVECFVAFRCHKRCVKEWRKSLWSRSLWGIKRAARGSPSSPSTHKLLHRLLNVILVPRNSRRKWLPKVTFHRIWFLETTFHFYVLCSKGNLGISEDEKEERRKVQHSKETDFLRLKRTRLEVTDFESLKVIGRGAFGEVSPITMNNAPEIVPECNLPFSFC